MSLPCWREPTLSSLARWGITIHAANNVQARSKNTTAEEEIVGQALPPAKAKRWQAGATRSRSVFGVALQMRSNAAFLDSLEGASASLLKPSLESPHPAAQTPHMSTKEIVQDLLQKLPEDVSLHDVAREIEFVAAVRQGLAEIDRGERIPIEEIERELPSWVIR